MYRSMLIRWRAQPSMLTCLRELKVLNLTIILLDKVGIFFVFSYAEDGSVESIFRLLWPLTNTYLAWSPSSSFLWQLHMPLANYWCLIHSLPPLPFKRIYWTQTLRSCSTIIWRTLWCIVDPSSRDTDLDLMFLGPCRHVDINPFMESARLCEHYTIQYNMVTENKIQKGIDVINIEVCDHGPNIPATVAFWMFMQIKD